MQLKLIDIDYRSARYFEELALRDRVLRRPLGLSIDDLRVAEERCMRHFGMLADDTLIACALVLAAGPTAAIIRQMAVVAEYRGHGVGSRLLRTVEQRLAGEGVRSLSLSARVSAMGFYQKAGYTAYGEEYLAVTLPHRWMRKNLTAPSRQAR
jgi:hypothetical protein